MGVGGHFWELLKPYARTEGHDFLRDKRVAVDLSFWIVQHETAIRGAYVRNPHLRLIFFRTVNLFSKFGALPVFVADGRPSPLKSQARIRRFFQASGIDLSNHPMAEEGVSMERNPAFLKCIRECMELLELLGMPVLKAKGEAEELCAQLNTEGRVDACITSDSDAFLFGANCVVKRIQPNSKEPFECYYMSDIEAGLGLKRKHLIAIALLVGNDHDLKGVQGIGVDTALRFVRSFSEDEVLTRLSEIGRGESLPSGMRCSVDFSPNLEENSPKKKSPHCSFCGHPGSKKAHLTSACEYCNSGTSSGCNEKPLGFKCGCISCDLDRREKEKKRSENWQIMVCQKIVLEHNFPNAEIIDMYLNNNVFDDFDDGPRLEWKNPNLDMLVDHLAFYQKWEPSYIRQRILPMLSTIFLRETASNPKEDLLYGQYEFDSIQRVKTRFAHQLLVINWKKATPVNDNITYIASDEESEDPPPANDNIIYIVSDEESEDPTESSKPVKSTDLFDGVDAPQMCFRDGCWFLMTDENMDLVKAAFPEKFEQFFKEKELKEMKSKRKKLAGTPQPTTGKNMQLSITEFFRSSKGLCKSSSLENLDENPGNSTGSSEGKRKISSPKLSKSVRRRLLFS